MTITTSILALTLPALLAACFDAVVVGFALCAARARLGAPLGRWSSFIALIATFAALDAGWVWVAAPLNLSCSIGNPTIASAIGITEPFWLNEGFPLGWFEIAGWSAQAVVAATIAARLASSPGSKPSESA